MYFLIKAIFVIRFIVFFGVSLVLYNYIDPPTIENARVWHWPWDGIIFSPQSNYYTFVRLSTENQTKSTPSYSYVFWNWMILSVVFVLYAFLWWQFHCGRATLTVGLTTRGNLTRRAYVKRTILFSRCCVKIMYGYYNDCAVENEPTNANYFIKY